MKSASIYLRKGAIFIRTVSRTEHGLGMVDGPPATLAVGSPPGDVGEAVLASLARSRSVPHPTSWEGLNDDPMLREANVKTWSAFSRSASVVEVRLDAEFVLTPTRNEGARGGFAHLNEKALHLPATASAEELGRAVEQAFTRCE